jgi:hypothetical protein
MARAYPGCVTPKSQYKRLNRLVNNPRLHAERDAIGRCIYAHIVGDKPRPVILVDWTEIGDAFHALTAAIPFGGRSFPIVWRVYPEGMQNSPEAHRELLQALRPFFPEGVRPILVTNGAFRSPWFRAVRKMGWDYVGRISNLNTVLESDPLHRGEQGHQLVKRASDTVCDLGEIGVFGGRRRMMGRVVLGKRYVRNPKRAHRKRTNRDRGFSHLNAIKRNATPWVLMTSIQDLTAEQIDAIYALRMRIEHLYRDMKNPRFGWALRHLRLQKAARYEVLLLLATLALLVVVTVGQAGELHGYARTYQSNTICSRRVLSLFVLGQAIFQRSDLRPITMAMWRKALQTLADTAFALRAAIQLKSGET